MCLYAYVFLCVYVISVPGICTNVHIHVYKHVNEYEFNMLYAYVYACMNLDKNT